MDYNYHAWTTQGGRLSAINSYLSSTPTVYQQQLAYGYNSVGNLTAITDNQPNASEQSFTYDGLNRLLTASASGGVGDTYSESYTYDNYGRLASKSNLGSYTYGDTNHDHAVTGAGGATYQYDANGNQTQRSFPGNSATLTYDAENRLIQVSSASDVIFADFFESGTVAAWNSSQTDGGDLSVTPAAALQGSYGLQAVIDDTVVLYTRDDTPANEKEYRSRLYFQRNTLTMDPGKVFNIFKTFTGVDTGVYAVRVWKEASGSFTVSVLITLDSAATVETAHVPITTAPTAIEVRWKAATGPGANNGIVEWWVDGVAQTAVTGLDTDTLGVEYARLGPQGSISTTRGTIYLDSFVSRRSTYQGLGNDLPTGTTSSFTYDGDGSRVQETNAYMNLAAGITPTGSAPLYQAEMLTNGDRWADDGAGNSRQFAYTNTGGELHSVQVDLGAAFPVDKVVVWHYAGDGRTYHATRTQVSSNGTDWVTVFDSAVSGEYPETASGHAIPFPSQSVRYVRDYLQGSTSNGGNHWVELEVWGRATVAYLGDFEWLGSPQTMVRTYRAGGQSIAVRHGNGGGTAGLTYLLSDHLGSASMSLDPVPNAFTGQPNVLSVRRYKAWGEGRYAGGDIPTDQRFTGQRQEISLGLYFYNARWLDPCIMQFIQPDTLIPDPYNPLDWNRYSYTNNNPANYIDPTGHAQICADGDEGGGCGGMTPVKILQSEYLYGNTATVDELLIEYVQNHPAYDPYSDPEAIDNPGADVDVINYFIQLAKFKAAVGESSSILDDIGATLPLLFAATVVDGADLDGQKEPGETSPRQQYQRITKAESPIWRNLQPYRADIKMSGAGRNKRFYQWDYTHGDIEVYDSRYRHLGSMDPATGEMYKPAVPGRKLEP